MFPDSLKRFVDIVSALPGIGPRQATRLAFYLIRHGKTSIADLAEAAARLSGIHTCARCFFPYEMKRGMQAGENLCSICADPKRDQLAIAIVEKETDLLSLEKSKKWRGRYLVLGELGKDGMLDTEQKLRLKSLTGALAKGSGQANEILIGLNPTTLGDIEAGLILEELKPFAKKITRLGRGLPTGGEIEFADEETLGGALENRR
jgi:recombination protein RecR